MDFLDYENYRAWREGHHRTLDDILPGGSDRMRNLLGTAGAWAAELGLEPEAPEAMEFHGWRENAGTVLAARPIRNWTDYCAPGFVAAGRMNRRTFFSTPPRPGPHNVPQLTHWA